MLSTPSDVTLPRRSCSSPPKRNCTHASTHVAVSEHKSKCEQMFSCMAINKCTHTHWHIIAPTTVATTGIISANHTRSISHAYITSYTVTTSQHHITPSHTTYTTTHHKPAPAHQSITTWCTPPDDINRHHTSSTSQHWASQQRLQDGNWDRYDRLRRCPQALSAWITPTGGSTPGQRHQEQREQQRANESSWMRTVVGLDVAGI